MQEADKQALVDWAKNRIAEVLTETGVDVWIVESATPVWHGQESGKVTGCDLVVKFKYSRHTYAPVYELSNLALALDYFSNAEAEEDKTVIAGKTFEIGDGDDVRAVIVTGYNEMTIWVRSFD